MGDRRGAGRPAGEKGQMAETIPAWVDGRLATVDKLEVHRRGLWHPAVSVFLMDGARTLLQQRAMGKYHSPGLWANACCTHPRPGEDPAACATSSGSGRSPSPPSEAPATPPQSAPGWSSARR